MTKRPRGIYLITFWFFLFFAFQINPLIRSIPIGSDSQVSDIVKFIPLVAFLFLIYEIVGIIQLRAVPIWIYIVLIGLASLLTVFRLIRFNFPAGITWRPIALVVIVLIFNGLSIWYLLRPSFQKIRMQFRKERDQAAMMRLSQKQLRKFDQGKS